jgi:hypothetical protein
MEPSPLAVLIEERKNKAIETLSVQFSRNAMPMEEYERLVEYINRAESERELAIIEKLVDETVRYGSSDRDPGQSRRERNRDSGREPNEPAATWRGIRDQVRDAVGKTSFSLLSTRKTPGDVLQETNNTFVSLMGTNVIDIREGDLPPGPTEIDAVSIMGEVKILVPRGVSVRMNAFPIMGDCRVDRGVETQRFAGEPELIISGCALMGSITVKLQKERRR